MSYFLPPQGLNQLWDHVLTAVHQPGLQDFRDPELFIEAKGTKLLFKYPDAPSDLLAVMENFDLTGCTSMWAKRPAHCTATQEHKSTAIRHPKLRHTSGDVVASVITLSGQNFYHESMLRDAGGMTTLTPPSSRLRRGGILYGQMYSLTKEIIDAAHSKQRSFGVREEYRISWTLFQSVLTVLRSLIPEIRSNKPLGPLPYLWAVRSPVFVDFLWHNINKFTTGFELVRAQCSPGLTTWEQTKMMDVFLRCLRVAVRGYDYSREGALWWSRRELPQPVGLPQVRYGLGFG
ncbi:hypothetical protein EDB80DRAFT_685825 [Ilyonectria destructans]|nr:hypothetical protein EDB80DRAFT_685825 [Ilyonectria destructans]